MGTDEQSERADLASDLKATTEQIAHRADRIKSIEDVKGKLPPDHSAMLELSRTSERLAEQLEHLAKTETALAEEAGSEPG